MKSLIKILLLSRPVKKLSGKGETITILGNGPSLKNDFHKIKGKVMAVNMFATSEVFTQIRPRYYTIVDIAFFARDPMDYIKVHAENIIQAFERVTWRMTLFLPFEAKGSVLATRLSHLVEVVYFNKTSVTGRFFYSLRLGMPPPQNVLIACLMLSIWMGFKKVYILGADHDWHRHIALNAGRVVLLDSHFYESAKVRIWYNPITGVELKLHELFFSFAKTFKSYHMIQRFAKSKGVKIINLTEHSYIDAFVRTNNKEKSQWIQQ